MDIDIDNVVAKLIENRKEEELKNPSYFEESQKTLSACIEEARSSLRELLPDDPFRMQYEEILEQITQNI